MYFLYAVLILFAIYDIAWMEPLTPTTTSDRRAEAVETYARGMIVYHHAAQKYHHANPSFTGIVPASNLALPDGYGMSALFQAQIGTGGWVIVSAVTMPLDTEPGSLAREIQAAKDDEAGVGIIQNGHLVSARFDPLTLPVPLPEGSLIIATAGG